MRWRPRAVIAVTAVAIVACGGSAARSAGSSAATLKAKTDYAACMRHKAVPMKDPDENGDLTFDGLVARSTFVSAQNACESIWPPSHSWNVDQIIRHQEQAATIAACLQQHGVPVETSGGGTDVRIQPSAGASPAPAAADLAATQACQAEAGPTVLIKQPGH